MPILHTFFENKTEKEVNNKMQTVSNIKLDFVASHLRRQLSRLSDILNNIEEGNKVDCEYTSESLREVETNIRQIRKLCINN